MRLDDKDRLTLSECRARALRYLAKRPAGQFASASDVGNAIWPNSEMRAQGLGGAATGRILPDPREGTPDPLPTGILNTLRRGNETWHA